ncbi:T9SS type A sorting domain-containing protein [Hyphobacterium sp. CCMP332]|nr:T9SS type A sorting domain-containing protein [Hyphobacterium sp. CCMP332]
MYQKEIFSAHSGKLKHIKIARVETLLHLKKTKSYLFFSFLTILITHGISFAQLNQLPINYKFLALGDSYTIGQSVSITQRWPLQFVDSLASRGISNSNLTYIAQTGWKTTELIQNIQNVNPPNDFDLVSLCIGVNNQFQRASISDYKRDLIILISKAKEKAKQSFDNVLVLSIPDYAYTPFGQASLASAQISSEIDDFNLVKKSVCDSLGVRYINVTSISRLGLVNPQLVANDGLHPSALQYSMWVGEILSNISAISELNNKEVLVFPNPLINSIKISEKVKNWRILDLNSKEVRNSSNDPNNLNLKSGVYIIELKLHSEEIHKKKLVVK